VKAVVVVLVLLFAGIASAQIPRVVVEVGESVSLDVGNAIGWQCDDPLLVSPQITTQDGHNVWIVTGVTEGETTCRIGTELGRDSYLVYVEVQSTSE
jgi:hypothetical protein